MIEFMCLGAPRSGTAWCANWLTTSERLCLHDPLWDVHYADWDSLKRSRPLGIACTGIALFADWVNAHPAPKVILHRDPHEVNRSCARLGFGPVPPALFAGLRQISGLHVDWRALIERPEVIHEWLFAGQPFDAERHASLRNLTVTSRYTERTQNPEVLQRLGLEIACAAPDRPDPSARHLAHDARDRQAARDHPRAAVPGAAPGAVEPAHAAHPVICTYSGG